MGTKVITRFADGPLKKLNFSNEQEAIDFCSFVQGLDPDDDADVKNYNDTVHGIENPETVQAAREIELTKNRASLVSSIHEIDERLTYSNSSVYFRDTGKISVPERIVDEILEWNVDRRDLEPLFNFWRLAALNPDPEAREGLYRFITDLNLSLTEEGLFVAYRNVTVVNEKNFELVKMVSDTWLDQVSKQRKPSKYFVVRIDFDHEIYDEDDDDYTESETRYEVLSKRAYEDMSNIVDYYQEKYEQDGFTDVNITDWELLGNLQDVYEDIVKESDNVQYTDQHTRTMKINIGTPVSMKRSDCDPSPHNNCSRGLHVGSRSFMSPDSFGNRGLVVLVNPRNVVAVPHEYGTAYKLRCCEYLPIALADYTENGSIIEVGEKVLADTGLDYVRMDVENLRMMLDNQDITEVKQHLIVPEDLGWIDVTAIFNHIDKFVEERTVKL